jgi:hypothetical protein
MSCRVGWLIFRNMHGVMLWIAVWVALSSFVAYFCFMTSCLMIPQSTLSQVESSVLRGGQWSGVITASGFLPVHPPEKILLRYIQTARAWWGAPSYWKRNSFQIQLWKKPFMNHLQVTAVFHWVSCTNFYSNYDVWSIVFNLLKKYVFSLYQNTTFLRCLFL